jgi:hypothetical protein
VGSWALQPYPTDQLVAPASIVDSSTYAMMLENLIARPHRGSRAAVRATRADFALAESSGLVLVPV